MSEENTRQEEFSSGFVGGEQEIIIEFADGKFPVPDYIIRGLGGADKLKVVAPALEEKTFNEFQTAFRQIIQKRDLNDFQASFIANHFGKLF